ncbi:Gfo/Idh/MocA family protein [Georgenia faecalis]|uniref:Gfo/Idh/MocA family protein n=1 Tax=Georgenia faecalis TaxID=2483799 RepID=UPI000FDC7D4A|nr:Gfo/Idh/MocA family oxidoreductase [Georgenia faecalis]
MPTPEVPVRVAVLGVGGFGVEHARRYAEHPGADLVAVVDADEDRARRVGARFGARARRDLEDLLAHEELDAVSVCLPSDLHADAALRLVAAGACVLLEKPVATARADAERLAAAERPFPFVMPGHVLRFAARHTALKAAVDAGRIGRPVALTLRRHRTRDHDERYPGEHPAMLTSIHDLDLALWLTSSRPVAVRSVEARVPGRNQPAAVTAEIVMASGAVCSVQSSWVLPDGADVPDAVEVVGTGGVLSLGDPAGDGADELGEALDREIAHFLDRVAARSASPVVALADGVAAVLLAHDVIGAGRAT